MAGMFSPEMMKLAQEQMANMTPEQMQAMQRQVLACLPTAPAVICGMRQAAKLAPRR